MTKLSSYPQQQYSGSPQEGLLEITDFPSGIARSRFGSRFLNIERRSPSTTLFQIDEGTFGSTLPRPSHWSIAWSDLMMTMFVLFLSMFTYQVANQEFLQKKEAEMVGGDTTEALQSLESSGAFFPFAPIHPGLPLPKNEADKNVELAEKASSDQENAASATKHASLPEEPGQVDLPSAIPQAASENTEKIALLIEKEQALQPQTPPLPSPAPIDPVLEPRPLALGEPPSQVDQFQEIYALSKGMLESNNLDKFAAIDIIPDKTMRIILTGDLLFEPGETELSPIAKSSLAKITQVIRNSPYMINVVGHTDNIPMRSARFQSNWELSVARAATVARFLIDDSQMNPNQFVVSGYSSYRPVVANTTTANRAKNRRVEIIMSKRLPQPLPATPQNLN